MKAITRRTLLASCVLAPAASAVAWKEELRAATAPRGGPRVNYFPNVVLRTHENKPVRFYDDLIRGKIVMINFMYAHCEQLCPKQTANLATVQQILGRRVGRDIFMYSLTLKPEQDTPQVLKQYADSFGIGPGWLFLTGKPEDVETLRQKLGFVDSDPELDRDKSQHIGVVLYGNEALDRWAACPALSNPSEIAKYVLWMEPLQ
jgi:protein SCO1/2